MGTTPKEIRIYEIRVGKVPFTEWLDSLRDIKAQSKIRIRLARLEQGNLGNYRSVGEGVCELKIDYGPGYRVYFGQVGSTIVVLLSGVEVAASGGDVGMTQSLLHQMNRSAMFKTVGSVAVT